MTSIMLIATPNDEFNTLAAIRAVESRDRSQVFQFAPSSGSEYAATRPRARLLVSPSFSFITASEQMLSGGVFRSTPPHGAVHVPGLPRPLRRTRNPDVPDRERAHRRGLQRRLVAQPLTRTNRRLADRLQDAPAPVVDEAEVIDAMRENKPMNMVV